MNERRTLPAAPTYLLTRFLTGPHREAIIGDLVEACHDGRSDAWYRRQAIRAVAAAFVHEVRQDWFVAIAAIFLSACLNDVFMMVIRPVWIHRLDLWYRLLIGGLITMEWDALRHTAYNLGLEFVTVRLLYCALACSAAWTMTRLSRAPHGVVVTLLVVPQLCLCVMALPSVVRGFGQPTAYSVMNVLWYLVFCLLAVPASICLGGHDGRNRGAFHVSP